MGVEKKEAAPAPKVEEAPQKEGAKETKPATKSGVDRDVDET